MAVCKSNDELSVTALATALVNYVARTGKVDVPILRSNRTKIAAELFELTRFFFTRVKQIAHSILAFGLGFKLSIQITHVMQ